MEDTFQQLYEKYHHDLFQFLFYMVKSREQAEDLVQEVYIRVLKSYDKFEGRSSEKTWLISIARHVAIDWFRKQKTIRQRILERFDWDKQQIEDEQQPLPDEVAIQNEQVQWIYRALQTCSIDQRSVVILRYIQELSITETAEVLGWTVSKVKTTQHRAIKQLQKHINNLSEKEGLSIEKTGVE
ncbi:RNA polymerase sigma factor SigX [Metabacillus endolithicus]|uniref:RNA polymerase sigma factor n=1 Tax=Metabacillus endolithicus TaxID=1535204 RepID=A0ABW5BWH3_9BACI|nr:RNA polymerase sigma factor SigX [Metabacillus endolithicus]UPG64357.1 RNA polymerase sigma factor SigX [Metabacillus endolithicus]